MTGHTQHSELSLPDWLPMAAGNYLQHTVMGQSIRAVARARSCHPSTILRQIRRLEAMRDDPLVDAALESLSTAAVEKDIKSQGDSIIMSTEVFENHNQATAISPNPKIDQDGLMVLRRLCERGAVLAVAREMESAVVVREDEEGQSIRTGVVDRSVAQIMALQNWITCKDPDARVVKYTITPEGKRATRELTAAEENKANVLSDARADNWNTGVDRSVGTRYMVAENPIMSLSRRKDKTGKPFISREQLAAGENLRQDFVLSDVTAHELRQSHENLVVPQRNIPKGVAAARRRLKLAIDDLGPGLADVALECCCFQNGLEVTEKKMGWSSRSGKIVLRIALTRLIKHYKCTQGKFAPLIG